jgi:hypothetical protein
MSFKTLSAILAGSLLIASCGKDATSTSSSSGAFTTAISTVANSVATTGSGMTSTVFQSQNYYPLLTATQLTSNMCGIHGEPQMPSGEGGGNMNNGDTRYPYVFTYCAMTVNDGDTVRGSFDLAKGLICSLEKGGLQFAGALQSITVNFSDTDCWPSGGPGGGGGPTTGTLNATGTTPASFNHNFEKGVVFTFNDGSETLTFKFAANISDTSIEFIGLEDWTGGNNGVMAGKLNKSTGELQFEKRDERISDSCSGGSCGWNRHTRLFAHLTMSGGEPSGLQSLSYAYSDLQSDKLTTNPTNGFGQFISSEGSLSSGINSRYFSNSTSNTSASGLKNHALWTETTNTKCMTNAGIDTAGGSCTASGIDVFNQDTMFALFDAGITGHTHLSPSDWLTAYTTFNFTAVDPNIDTPFAP